MIFHARTLGFVAFTTTSWALEKPGPLPRQAPKLAIFDQQGNSLLPAQEQSSYILYHFMFLHCSYVCGITFSYLQNLHEELDEPIPERLLMISVTVDPERDQTRDLYDAWLSLNSPAGWSLARHNDQNTMHRDLEALGVSYYQLQSGDFNHSAFFYLVDPGGRLIKVFDPAEGLKPIAAELKRITATEAPR